MLRGGSGGLAESAFGDAGPNSGPAESLVAVYRTPLGGSDPTCAPDQLAISNGVYDTP